MTQSTEGLELRPHIFWWVNELGETRHFRFSSISATPPPKPLREADRAKFLKKLDFGLSKYQIAKRYQENMYGKEIANLYRPGHEPREVVEARKRADEERLAEMEASDSDDHRMPARIGAGPGGVATQAPEARMPQSLPHKKRRRDTFAHPT